MEKVFKALDELKEINSAYDISSETISGLQNEMVEQNLSVAQCLHLHPVMSEKSGYKEKYVNVLQYFTELYSQNDTFAQAMFQNYKEKLIGDSSYNYDANKIKKAFRKASAYQLNKFKLFTYRYNLLFDCFFINAFDNSTKAKEITDKIKTLFKPRYQSKIEKLYEKLYSNVDYLFPTLSEQIKCWNLNKSFLNNNLQRIVITANMSAGKSTLINAFVGKKVNRTQNDVCTAKIHYIFNKAYEDYFSYELDNKMNIDADLKTLMEDDENNKTDNIYVSTYFRLCDEHIKRLCIIDTPGVNSSFDDSHKKMTETIIKKKEYEKLICVLNAENIGTDDEKKHLCFIHENTNDKKVIFAINKLDSYSKGEDSISETVSKVKEELISIGFENPIICPISAYVALLAKKMLWNEPLDEDEQFELKMYMRKFKDSEYDLSKYSINSKKDTRSDDTYKQLLKIVGYENFEQVIIN